MIDRVITSDIPFHMKFPPFLPLGVLSFSALLATMSQGAVSLVNITGITASGYNGTNGSGDPYFGRSSKLSQFQQGTIGGAGITQTSPADPSTWIHGSNWEEGWQSNKVGGTNIGWVVLDFGTSTTNLSEILLWNVTENGTGPQSRGVQTFNIWYSDSPIVTAPTAGGNYSFTSGGWTQLGSTNTLDIGGTTGVVDGVFSLSGISSARYVAIEILTNYGSTTSGIDGTNNRVGLAEIVVTQIPEPGTALLTGFAGLALLRRRRIS